MLKPEYLVSIADPVVEIYSQVEQDILSDVARRIVKTGTLTETAEYQLRKAKEFGYLNKDVSKILDSASTKTKRQVNKIMKDAGAMALEYDDTIYKMAGLNPLPIAKSPALVAMLLQGSDTTLKLIGNFTKTTAQMSTLAFNNALDRAFIQILSGVFSPPQAIKQAIMSVASQGVVKVAYPSGARSSIESAIRRAVTTGVNQSISKLQLLRAEELGCELVEVTAHAGARPEHAEWQGGVYSLKGTYKHYGNFYRETGYGTGEGLCGWNCYHSFYPYFEGLSTKAFSRDPASDSGRSNDEEYKNQQKQRYYERQVRNAKRECVTFNAAMEATDDEVLRAELYDQFQSCSVKLKNRESKLTEFLEHTGRKRQNEREWSAGFNRSVSGKAVWANRKSR